MNMNAKTKNLTLAAIIAALYVLLTYLAMLCGLDKYAVQLRFSEALTILPVFAPAAIPGLFVGCLLANILTGCAVWDIVFGSLATLIGAAGTYLLRRHRVLAVLPPICANVIIVPLVLRYAYGTPDALPYLMLTVGLGELVSCGVLGLLLGRLLDRYRSVLKLF